jgi:hypothetical protein
MYIGCLNYASTLGNWTLSLQVGVYKSIIVDGNSAIYDTYTLDSRNQTVNIHVEGTTESNETLVFNYEVVTLSNFFAPEVIVNTPEDLGNEVYNITWSCTDKNANDTNYFSVWLSADDGVSFQLLARNLTSTYYYWDSSGFLSNDYIIRIRAFSVDLVSGLATVDDEANYWPGDFADGFSPSWEHHGWPFGGGAYLVSVDEPADISYDYGDEGNSIIWTWDVLIVFHHFLLAFTPEDFYYRILRDGIELSYSRWDGSSFVEVNVDHLDVGIYNYTLWFWSPAQDVMKSDTVIVTVKEVPQLPLSIILSGSVGVGVGLLVLFLIRNRLHSK